MNKILCCFLPITLSCFVMRITAQNVGVGTASPLTRLHVQDGVSGAIPFGFTPLTVESNAHTYINILSPAANEGAILFGQPASSANGVIMYNNVSTPNGFQFRTDGNNPRVVITNTGNLGVSLLNPSEKLEVAGNVKANNFIFSMAKTYRLTLSGADCIPASTLDNMGINVGSGGAFMANSTTGKRLFTPVHLPDGAVMIKMTAYLYDNSTNANLRGLFHRKTILSNIVADNLGAVYSAGNSDVVTAYEAVINSFDNIVNNSLYTYFISWEPENTATTWQSSMEIRAVIFEYRMSTVQ